MELLQISSCLFSIVILYAFNKQNIYYHHIILLTMITSFFTHAINRNKYIYYIDYINAHILYILLLYEAYNLEVINYYLFIYPIIILLIYSNEYTINNNIIILKHNWKKYHFILHIITIIGMIHFLYIKY